MAPNRRFPPTADERGVVVVLNASAVGAARARAFTAGLERWVAEHRPRGGVRIEATSSTAEGIAAAARAAAAGATLVVAAGGDGTVRSVTTGLLGAGDGAQPTLGIAALGRGNDLARSLGIGRGVAGALACLAGGHERLLDVGRAVIDGQPHVFVNALGLGLDAAIARRARGVRLPGAGAYAWAALCAILRERGPWHVQGVLDGRPLEGDVTLLHLGNGSTTGGGFSLTPRASPFDGQLDACAVLEHRRLGLLALLGHVALGAHAPRPAVPSHALTSLELGISPRAAVHADGEVLSEGASVLRVDVHAAALRVRLPGREADWFPPAGASPPEPEPRHDHP